MFPRRQTPVSARSKRRGVTLVELLVVVICLVVAAAMVVPQMADGAVTQLRAAADVLVADLEYAQSQSISHADDPRVLVIDSTGAGYHIAPRSAPQTPVTDPINRGGYVNTYGTGRASNLPRVRVGGYSLGGDNRLGFGGVGQLDQSSAATVTLAAGGRSVTISLDPVTGEATVGDLQ